MREAKKVARHAAPEAEAALNACVIDRLLTPMVYDALYAYARRVIDWSGKHLDITASDLLHETMLRLLAKSGLNLDDQRHLTAVVRLGMRRMLVDQSRRRQALKRQGIDRRVKVEEIAADAKVPDLDRAALEESVRRLKAAHERAGRLVDLHVWDGLTFEECGVVLGVSRTTLAEDWSHALRWLARDLRCSPVGQSSSFQ
jgi:RNA polymerase sigma-70 factor (ECF subfamily)